MSHGRDDRAKSNLREVLRHLASRMRVPERPVAALADEATPTHQLAGETIFSPSSTHTFTYVLVSGVVRLECRDHRKRPVTLQLVRPGHVFGLSWRPHSEPRAI